VRPLVSGLALDHIIFFCAPGAPEADALLGRGLHEGPGNSHPGQGTINRRFFFRNLYLELLWVEDFDEAQAPEARRTGLWDRWINRHNGSCPIGLVFRPRAQAGACTVRLLVVRAQVLSRRVFDRGRA
jgi:Glyoxalase-like domain